MTGSEYGLLDNLVAELSPKPKKEIFVICPVRRPQSGFFKKMFHKAANLLFGAIDPWAKKQDAIKTYVAKLEADGYEVYWPSRDNPYQKTDFVGTQIVTFNRALMCRADEVHIWYEKTSTGSIFDIGMFFALVYNNFKKFVIINRENIAPTPGKSFENVVLALEKYFDNPVANGLKERRDNYGK